MTLEPLDTRIVVRPNDSETRSPGGLLIPENAQETPARGEVLAVGENVKQVAVNDVVVHSRYAGTQVSEDGEDLLILAENDILARSRAS